VDQNFIKIAEKNIKRAGVSKYVTQYNLDIKTAKSLPLDLGTMDVALIDLGDPWTVIPQVRELLKGSGSVFAICPTMNQLEKLTISLVANEFTDIESTEHILRTIEAREGKTRHSFQGIGHTTYLCFARKAFFDRASRHPDKSDNDILKDTTKASDGHNGASSKKTRTEPAKEGRPSKKITAKKPVAKKTTRKKA
jgi:tRNA (adenine57-N1/adenine58-N1)-methyltransferase